MTAGELVGLIVGIITILGAGLSAIKWVVMPIISMQKSILKIEWILQSYDSFKALTSECMEEVKTKYEEHESRLDIIESSIKIYHGKVV